MPVNTSIQIGRVGNNYVVQIDSPIMVMLVDQMAATILKEVETMPIDGHLTTDPTEGVGGKLAEKFNWASHGYINALIDEVSFVYAFVKYLVDHPKYFLLSETKEECMLYAEALSAFQDWKTRLIIAEKAVHGRTWGDATDFNRANWTDLNDLLLNPK